MYVRVHVVRVLATTVQYRMKMYEAFEIEKR
jgi:hypothetical protein